MEKRTSSSGKHNALDRNDKPFEGKDKSRKRLA